MPLTKLFFSTLLCLCACSKSSDDGSGDSGSGKDSGTSNADSGAMGGGPCGEAGICNLTVEDAKVIDCESDSGTMPSATAKLTEDGKLEVTHLAAETGCCPETFNVTAELNLRHSTLTADYEFLNDFCDCVCALDVSYTLSGIPEGESYTFTAHGVVVEIE